MPFTDHIDSHYYFFNLCHSPIFNCTVYINDSLIVTFHFNSSLLFYSLLSLVSLSLLRALTIFLCVCRSRYNFVSNFSIAFHRLNRQLNINNNSIIIFIHIVLLTNSRQFELSSILIEIRSCLYSSAHPACVCVYTFSYYLFSLSSNEDDNIIIL